MGEDKLSPYIGASRRVIRQSGPIVMSNGHQIVVIPRHNLMGVITMGNIIRDVGFSNDEFRALL